DLYFKKIYPSAVESVLKVCDLYRSGNPPHIHQDESKATYERRCTRKHTHIDWNKPVGQVYDLIRGANPAPGAWTKHGDTEVRIFDSSRQSGDGISGRVIAVAEEGVTVQCIGGRILVKRVKPAGGEKQAASVWAASVGLSAGDVLGA
ncbi:MAG: methionyl-tRNA formyltransferase, partial [Paracoccaceae bacterium]|nr:methionyl-tRNA formyltransferase [Paracoccaceae bacterium]